VDIAPSRSRRNILSHCELDVYRRAFAAAMRIYALSKSFPRDEVYSLTDQVRRSSRSVCANLAEAWRKRRYEAAFVSKLSDSEAEAAETQVWLAFAGECGLLGSNDVTELRQEYDAIIGIDRTDAHASGGAASVILGSPAPPLSHSPAR
jgi:four helix bundle protein